MNALAYIRSTTIVSLLAAGSILCAVWADQPVEAATSGSTVGATVPSSVSLDTSGCRSGTADVTMLDPAPLNNAVIGSGDCTLGFGSSNNTARLELHQGDGSGTMMQSFGASQSRLQDDFRLEAVDARTSTDAWAVGQRGTIHHWDGTTWTPVPSATTANFRDVAAGSSSTVWAVASNGSIRGSTTTGATWATQHTISGALNAVDALDASTAWAVGVGGQARYTINGTAWNPAVSGTTSELNDIVAVTALVVVAVGDGGTIVRSTDGGQNFAPVASTTTDPIEAVAVRSSTDLYAVGGSNTILRSIDAGASWAPVATGMSFDYKNVALDSTDGIVSVVDQGNVVRSDDDGATWSTYVTDHHNNGLGGDHAGGTFFAVGQGSMMMTSTDVGLSWAVAPQFRANFRGVYASSRQRAWAVGANGEIRVTTDGATMASQASGTTAELRDIDGVESMLWTVGSGGTIRHTANSGATWTAQSGGTTAILRSVDAVTDTIAWIGGGVSRAWRTTDAGATWRQSSLPGSSHIRAISAGSEDVAWASGSSGYLARTMDGGQTWTMITLPAAFTPAASIYVSGAEPTGQQLVAAGSTGAVYRTTDGGASWTPVPGADGVHASIHAVDARDTHSMALSVSSAGAAYSLDGVTWTLASAGAPSRTGAAISFPSAQAVWVGTDSWGLLRTVPSANSIPDFNDDPADAAGADWGTPGAAFFGGCLRTATPTTTPLDWAVDGDGDCNATDTDPWRPIVADAGTTGTAIAATTTAGTSGAVGIVFAMRTGSVASAGLYGGSATISVYAPG